MRKVLALVQRELLGYFSSPLAWVVATAFLLYNGFWFWIIVSYLNRPETMAMAPLKLIFGGTVFFWFFLLFILPVITMRLLAEERRSGTLEVLLTSPVSEAQVVVGKFLGAFLFYLFLWLPTAVYPVILASYSTIDWKVVLSGYLGIALLGMPFMAIGLLTSALTRNQILAALFAFLILAVLFAIPILENLVINPAFKGLLSYMSLWDHMDDFAKGIVDTRRMVYHLSVTGLFLFLATRALEAAKGR
jgi:ABC-2 type transport system permease protein